jgi:hypothetical protein
MSYIGLERGNGKKAAIWERACMEAWDNFRSGFTGSRQEALPEEPPPIFRQAFREGWRMNGEFIIGMMDRQISGKGKKG